MKLSLCFLVLLVFLPVTSISQEKKTPTPILAPPLVRTTSRREVRRLGYGGNVTIIGAPFGSISIEGWSRSEVEVSAEIHLQANTEADLNLLAAVNTFVIDEDLNHLRVLSTGTHDKAFMRRVAKKFPKPLLGLPWKIDYRIRVPMSVDIEVNGGRGAISVVGVEGNIRLSAAESLMNLKLTGGTLSATVGIGKISLAIPTRSWRGVGGELRLAAGEMILEIPTGFSGDVDAEALRSGKIENSFAGLESLDRNQIPRRLRARAGAGGSFFKLVVGDGTIYIKPQTVISGQ